MEACLSWYGELIKDANQILKTCPLWCIQFIHKEGNQLAHVLAKNGLNSEIGDKLWLNDYPAILQKFVTSNSRS